MNANELLTTEPHMAEDERQLRDRYIHEYLRDSDWSAAALRMGYTQETCLEFAKQMSDCPYVRRKISEATAPSWIRATPESDAANPYTQDPEHIQQQVISTLMREMHAKGGGSSQVGRIAAAKELARIYKMGEIEDKSKVIQSVMIVPAMGNVDDWEKQAKAQQAKLKEDVKK